MFVTNQKNKKYRNIKYDKIEIRIHTEYIHCIAITHRKRTYFAHSHSKQMFSKEEDGGWGLTVTETKPEAEEEQVIADMEEEDMLENVM